MNKSQEKIVQLDETMEAAPQLEIHRVAKKQPLVLNVAGFSTHELQRTVEQETGVVFQDYRFVSNGNELTADDLLKATQGKVFAMLRPAPYECVTPMVCLKVKGVPGIPKVSVPVNTSISTLKKRIAQLKACKYPADEQGLLYKGRLLEENSLLGDQIEVGRRAVVRVFHQVNDTKEFTIQIKMDHTDIKIETSRMEPVAILKRRMHKCFPMIPDQHEYVLVSPDGDIMEDVEPVAKYNVVSGSVVRMRHRSFEKAIRKERELARMLDIGESVEVSMVIPEVQSPTGQSIRISATIPPQALLGFSSSDELAECSHKSTRESKSEQSMSLADDSSTTNGDSVTGKRTRTKSSSGLFSGLKGAFCKKTKSKEKKKEPESATLSTKVEQTKNEESQNNAKDDDLLVPTAQSTKGATEKLVPNSSKQVNVTQMEMKPTPVASSSSPSQSASASSENPMSECNAGPPQSNPMVFPKRVNATDKTTETTRSESSKPALSGLKRGFLESASGTNSTTKSIPVVSSQPKESHSGLKRGFLESASGTNSTTKSIPVVSSQPKESHSGLKRGFLESASGTNSTTKSIPVVSSQPKESHSGLKRGFLESASGTNSTTKSIPVVSSQPKESHSGLKRGFLESASGTNSTTKSLVVSSQPKESHSGLKRGFLEPASGTNSTTKSIPVVSSQPKESHSGLKRGFLESASGTNSTTKSPVVSSQPKESHSGLKRGFLEPASGTNSTTKSIPVVSSQPKESHSGLKRGFLESASGTNSTTKSIPVVSSQPKESHSGLKRGFLESASGTNSTTKSIPVVSSQPKESHSGLKRGFLESKNTQSGTLRRSVNDVSPDLTTVEAPGLKRGFLDSKKTRTGISRKSVNDVSPDLTVKASGLKRGFLESKTTRVSTARKQASDKSSEPEISHCGFKRGFLQPSDKQSTAKSKTPQARPRKQLFGLKSGFLQTKKGSKTVVQADEVHSSDAFENDSIEPSKPKRIRTSSTAAAATIVASQAAESPKDAHSSNTALVQLDATKSAQPCSNTSQLTNPNVTSTKHSLIASEETDKDNDNEVNGSSPLTKVVGHLVQKPSLSTSNEKPCPKKTSRLTRCQYPGCKRRLPLALDFPCRCGGRYCGLHSVNHSCTFDYKKDHRRVLNKELSFGMYSRDIVQKI